MSCVCERRVCVRCVCERRGCVCVCVRVCPRIRNHHLTCVACIRKRKPAYVDTHTHAMLAIHETASLMLHPPPWEKAVLGDGWFSLYCFYRHSS